MQQILLLGSSGIMSIEACLFKWAEMGQAETNSTLMFHALLGKTLMPWEEESWTVAWGDSN